jgi:hypothetical protein
MIAASRTNSGHIVPTCTGFHGLRGPTKIVKLVAEAKAHRWSAES